MPVQVDTPINTGASAGWGLWGDHATSKVQAVSTNDGDDSVIYASSGGRLVVETMIFPPLAGVADPVTAASLTGLSREYLKGGGGRGYYALWNSVVVGANREAEVHVAAPNYVAVTYSAAGAGLALAVVNGEHGFQFSAAGGPSNKAEYWITHLYRTVTFTYTAGDAGEFAYMIGSLAGAFIGANLLFREMPDLARFIWRRRRFLILPSEYAEAFRSWQEA